MLVEALALTALFGTGNMNTSSCVAVDPRTNTIGLVDSVGLTKRRPRAFTVTYSDQGDHIVYSANVSRYVRRIVETETGTSIRVSCSSKERALIRPIGASRR